MLLASRMTAAGRLGIPTLLVPTGTANSRSGVTRPDQQVPDATLDLALSLPRVRRKISATGGVSREAEARLRFWLRRSHTLRADSRSPPSTGGLQHHPVVRQ